MSVPNSLWIIYGFAVSFMQWVDLLVSATFGEACSSTFYIDISNNMMSVFVSHLLSHSFMDGVTIQPSPPKHFSLYLTQQTLLSHQWSSKIPSALHDCCRICIFHLKVSVTHGICLIISAQVIWMIISMIVHSWLRSRCAPLFVRWAGPPWTVKICDVYHVVYKHDILNEQDLCETPICISTL